MVPQAGMDTDSEADGDGGASAAEAAATAVGAGLVYVCRTCGITTTSPENLQAHFDGAQHKCDQAHLDSCDGDMKASVSNSVVE
jgi:Zinc-finger of C2H2 type